MTDLPLGLREALEDAFVIPAVAAEAVVTSADGTTRVVWRLPDRERVESVLIPDARRLTLCVSSQVGCGMGCAFCATARLGLRRNLSASEILAQVTGAGALAPAGRRITHLVFMGMGEPLHNEGALRQALDVLTAPWGAGFSPRRITVSTVGLVPGLRRLLEETEVNVAVSVVSATAAQRSRLVPVERRYPVQHLVEFCRSVRLHPRRRITFEVVLLAGVNDAEEDAAALARLVRGSGIRVNLIPFNPYPGAPFRRPRPERVQAFQRVLLDAGVRATVRTPRGDDVAAACGQLAGGAEAGAA